MKFNKLIENTEGSPLTSLLKGTSLIIANTLLGTKRDQRVNMIGFKY